MRQRFEMVADLMSHLKHGTHSAHGKITILGSAEIVTGGEPSRMLTRSHGHRPTGHTIHIVPQDQHAVASARLRKRACHANYSAAAVNNRVQQTFIDSQ